MASVTNISHHLTNTGVIADELLHGMQVQHPQNAIALLFCDTNINAEALLQVLSGRLNIPVLGGTTYAVPLHDDDETEVSAMLTLVDKEDMLYSIAVSEPLTDDGCETQMRACFERCSKELGQKPAILMPIIPHMPGFNADICYDNLFAMVGDIPVFGGLNTGNFDDGKAALFANGKVTYNQMVMLALGGSVKPVFAMGSKLSCMSAKAPTITKAVGNTVYTLDDMTFCEYFESLDIVPEERVNGLDALVQYGPLPVRVFGKDDTDGSVPEIRCISYSSPEEGSATFSSALPKGAHVQIGIIAKDDVTDSAAACLTELMQNMRPAKAQGYKYDVLFSFPCIARYFAMLGGENLESQLLLSAIPKDLAVSSFYAFLEACPTVENGKLHNRTNNASIVMCAI